MSSRAVAFMTLVLVLSACEGEVTTIGRTGPWKVVSVPGFTHFRGAWSDGDLFCMGVAVDASTPAADTGVVDAAPPPSDPRIQSVLLRIGAEAVPSRLVQPLGTALWGTNQEELILITAEDALRTSRTGTLLGTFEPDRFADLRTVWSADADHVWIGGAGVFRLEDRLIAEAKDRVDRVVGIWGASAHDVWAVTDSGAIRHREGESWPVRVRATSYSLRAIWGSDATNVWAVGDHGTLLRFDGESWRRLPSGTDNDLRGVWGSSRDDVWIVGQGGTILHIGRNGVQPYASPTTEDLSAITGTSAGKAWAVGDRVILRFEP